jgi:hypothetical protein
MDSRGKESKGTIEVASQNEAIGRVKEMGLFPTRIVEVDKVKESKPERKMSASIGKATKKKGKKGSLDIQIKIPGLSVASNPRSSVLLPGNWQLWWMPACHYCAACACWKNRAKSYAQEHSR